MEENKVVPEVETSEVSVSEPIENKADVGGAQENKQSPGRSYGSGRAGGYGNRGNSNRSYGNSSNESYNKRNNFKRHKRKICEFCADRSGFIDYKDASKLSRFLTDRSKIYSRRSAGTCAQHQRELATALKRARYVALLPYCSN